MKSILQHLRFPFSLLLMPVFLYSVYCTPNIKIDIQNVILLFFVLHVFIYPSSNAYNSIQDRDIGSVGLIEKPLPITHNLFVITVVIDIIAMLLCLFINLQTAFLVGLYILASRLYSWRRIRLKQYPIIGFLTVFLCQGALVYFMVHSACNISWGTFSNSVDLFELCKQLFHSNCLIEAFVASLFIGSMYPLSQIYQHEQDANDGVRTISALLGYRNTFLFSGLQFVSASAFIFYVFMATNSWSQFTIYSLCQLPVISFFLFWFYQVMQDSRQSNFKNTMYMNIISAVCMNVCFTILLLIKFYSTAAPIFAVRSFLNLQISAFVIH